MTCFTFNVWRYCTALNFSSLLHVLPFHWERGRRQSYYNDMILLR